VTVAELWAPFDLTLEVPTVNTIPLRRLLPNVDCVTTGRPTNPPGDFGFTGPWYNTAIGGQGMLIEVNPSDAQVFVGWYTYAEAGEGEGESGQRWFSAQTPYTVGDRTFDLTVCSEVLYYLDEPAFDATLERLTGTVLHVHWRPPTQRYPFGGDDVRMLLTERFGAPDYSRETEKYVLDRWDRCGC